ncbi:DUF6455 family protein [Meridianimarinicoccus sp. RP-17]|uniref:DUF6455 family protein n=1 Tax=Meridianimarinicoccus zhengii TaxID=2056810 RepID=UPI000DAE0AB7|nr:DUF6455 family protein [Phycocomes zhengii]
MSRTDPKPLGDMVTHLWLAQSMARATGVDLAARQADGALTQQEWAGMVHRCRGCDWERSGGCHDRLARQEPGAAVVPQACANVQMFDFLGAATADADAREAG